MPGRDLEVEKDRVAAQHAFFKATDTPRIIDGETARSVPSIKSARSATKPKRTEAEVAAYGRKISDFADWCAGHACRSAITTTWRQRSRPRPNCKGWFVVEADQDPKVSPPLAMAQKGHKELMRGVAVAGYQAVQ